MPGVGLATLAEGRKAVACSHPLDPKSTQRQRAQQAWQYHWEKKYLRAKRENVKQSKAKQGTWHWLVLNEKTAVGVNE